MIYTVTLNPSIDYIVRLDKLVNGITNRTTSEEYYFGGKGINVSCVLAELDIDSTAYGFVAGFTTPDIEEASVKEAAIKTSYMPFILADHTKFRRVFSVTFAQLRQCCIITDALPDSKYSSETVIKEVKI